MTPMNVCFVSMIKPCLNIEIAVIILILIVVSIYYLGDFGNYMSVGERGSRYGFFDNSSSNIFTDQSFQWQVGLFLF